MSGYLSGPLGLRDAFACRTSGTLRYNDYSTKYTPFIAVANNLHCYILFIACRLPVTPDSRVLRVSPTLSLSLSL